MSRLLKPCLYTPPAELRSLALATLCGAPCAEIGAHNMMCSPALVSGPVQHDRAMTTWLPAERVQVSFQRAGAHTAVLLDGALYYATEALALPRECPSEVTFHAHFTRDCVEGKMFPRVLVFDAQQPEPTPASARYEALRTKFAQFLRGACTVQWVGFLSAAREVLRSQNFPHRIEALACLCDDPAVIVKPLLVEIA